MLERVPVGTLCRFLEAVAVHPQSDKSRVSEYAGMSERTATRALPVLEELGLIVVGRDGRCAATFSGARTGDPVSEYKEIIRRALIRYRPFEVLAAGIAVGESEADAARKAAVLLGGDPGLDAVIALALDLDVLARTTGGALVLADEVIPPDLGDLGLLSPEDVSSEARARMYIASKLGADASAFIDDVIWGGLSDALLAIHENPGDAVQLAGNAVEDFLRELAADRSLQPKAAKCNGAGQLATMLYGESILHVNHMHMVNGHSAARNTQGHSKDKRTHVPWDADIDSAFWAVTSALIIIRSVHAYVYKGRQIL